MKLSPRMIQTMEILQLPAMALEERIEQELEENPTLERREIRPEEQNGQADSPEVDSETPIVAHDSESGQSTADDFNRLDDFSNTYGTSFDSNTTESGEYRPSKPTPAGERDAKMDAMANTAARGQSLTEMLNEQWRFLEIDDPVVDTAGRHLINYIEEDGYLRTSDEEFATTLAEQFLDNALLAAGLLTDPRNMVERMNRLRAQLPGAGPEPVQGLLDQQPRSRNGQ